MMKGAILLEEHPNGLWAKLGKDEGTLIQTSDIEAICSVLVQGRSMDDALPPVRVIAAMIENRLHIEAIEGNFAPLPDWMDVADYGITPMEQALGNLEMFGGTMTKVRFG